MNICIDVGNTLTKIAVFDNDTIVHFEVSSGFGETKFKQLLQDYSDIKNVIISSVRKENPDFLMGSQGMSRRVLILDSTTPVPIQNRYKTPQSLGKDRLAAVVGANYLYPLQNILVIDAGSAITFEFINSAGEYLGGNIAPGLSMRFKSLHEYTSLLPLLEPEENFPLIGSTTKEAIVAGVQNSIIFETEVYIQEFGKIYPDMITLITGGDAKFFDNKLKNTIFVIPNLVLIGLNRILNFNA